MPIVTIRLQLEYYKLLGEKTLSQLTDAQLCLQMGEDGNSIATIIQHMHGNMMSRFTNFIITDGEKPWRDRESEFMPCDWTKAETLQKWQDGWLCVFTALEEASSVAPDTIIYIRNQGHSIEEAFLRQLSHYSYHVGQIVFLGKMIKGKDWVSLSIPLGESAIYNEEKFGKEKEKKHFTEEYLRDTEKK